MKRLTAGLLSAAVLATGMAVMAPAASADRCEHHYVRYYPVRGWGGGWRGWGGGCRHYYYRDCDDDRGPSIGTLLLGAAAGYGAYRLYDDIRSRHDHHKSDDD